MADYLVTDTELTGVANAIRTKGGTSSPLVFPSGFESAISAITTGKDFVSGTFTCPDEDTTYKIQFGKTFSKYLFLIELSDDSKTALVNSGSSYARPFAYIGVYPKLGMNNLTVDYNIVPNRYKSSTNEVTIGNSSALTTTGTYIEGTVRAVNSNAANYFIRGYSYKYTVVSLD